MNDRNTVTKRYLDLQRNYKELEQHGEKIIKSISAFMTYEDLKGTFIKDGSNYVKTSFSFILYGEYLQLKIEADTISNFEKGWLVAYLIDNVNGEDINVELCKIDFDRLGNINSMYTIGPEIVFIFLNDLLSAFLSYKNGTLPRVSYMYIES